MMRLARPFVGLLIVTGLTFAFGCSSSESKLLGRWVEDGKNDAEHYIEFFSDKTVTMKTPSMPLSGKWVVLNDGRIKADVDVPLAKLTILGELKGQLLILDIDGRESRFSKLTNEQVRKNTQALRDIDNSRNIAATRLMLRAICLAVDGFEVNCGTYPNSLDELMKNPGESTWQGPYLKGTSLPTDAWGKPFKYSRSGDGYKVWADGPDGRLEAQE